MELFNKDIAFKIPRGSQLLDILLYVEAKGSLLALSDRVIFAPPLLFSICD